MLPTKKSICKTEHVFSILFVCFCLSAVALFCLPANASTQKDSEAREAITRAEALRGQWTKDALREAIGEYDKAVLIWISVSEFSNASHAMLKSGDVYFVLSEYAEAMKHYQRAAALAAKAGDWLAKAQASSNMGCVETYLGNNDLAQRHLTKALDLFNQHKANRDATVSNAHGEALSNLAEVSYRKGNFSEASRELKTALELLQSDRDTEAKIHLFNGYITGSIGDPQKAVTEISRALDLYRETKNRIGEGLALIALGVSNSSRKDQKEAMRLSQEAVESFHSIGDRHNEAIALNSLGQVYEKLNDYPVALHYYDRALQLFQTVSSLDGVTIATFKLAKVNRLSGHLEQALVYYERCVKLTHAAGKQRTEANALNEIVMVYAEQGRFEQAWKQSQKVQKFYDTMGDFRGKATALNAYGDLLLKLRQKQRALDAYRRAFPLSEKVDDKVILLSTLYGLARANLELGSPDAALSFIQQSIKIIEELRTNVGSPELGASYFSGVGKHYELCIRILMELDRLRPGQDFAADALRISEGSRARLLLDLISESNSDIRQGVTPELLTRERELKGLIRSLANYEMELQLSRKDASELAAVTGEIVQLKAEYQDLQTQLREQNPRASSLARFVPAGLVQIQNELRDSDAMLLKYSLGEEKSYLWAVTSNSLHTYELPGRKAIQDAATEVYELVTARQRLDGIAGGYQADITASDNLYSEKASSLSEMLLGAVAGELGNRTLLIVAEGALQYIPLEALPVPGRQNGPVKPLLIETNEVVALPSASTLIAIRHARKHTSLPGKLVAVIADPVLSTNDERVRAEALPSSVALAATDKNLNQSLAQTPETLTSEGELPRLAHASEEADAITAVAPWGTTLVARGFDAQRETVMSADLSKYQIVHFATHGFLDSEHPELSSIVLTRVDRNGVKTDGLMTLHDIYSLNLSAELTVLSACQTALGKELKGEGPVGLSHSFMSAGSKSVVASLWKIDDRATAVLMADFYDGMLQQRMTPSAALRSAKLKMMHEKQRSAPYYWAGFVLQGEYTNHIAVDRHAWLRLALVFLFLPILIAAILLILQKRKRQTPPRQFT
jgi:CHAT domain-containing protein